MNVASIVIGHWQIGLVRCTSCRVFMFWVYRKYRKLVAVMRIVRIGVLPEERTGLGSIYPPHVSLRNGAHAQTFNLLDVLSVYYLTNRLPLTESNECSIISLPPGPACDKAGLNFSVIIIASAEESAPFLCCQVCTINGALF
jgi:hypothetical protein